MFKKTSALITATMILALVLSMFCGVMAAGTDATLTLYTIDGYNNPISGASFRLYGPDGTAVASAVTGSNGYVVMTISGEDIAENGTTNFTLVETAAPEGYEVTDNNWAVTVTSASGKSTVSVEAGGLWDTFYDWIEGSILTGADFAGGKLTVANTAKFYELPNFSMTVKGLSYTQMQGYTSEYELVNASGAKVATGHAIGFAVQSDESFKAQIAFDTKKLPAGTYTLTEKSTSDISGMNTDGIAFANGGKVTIGSSSTGETVSIVYTKPVVVAPPAVTGDNAGTENNDTEIGNDDNVEPDNSEVTPSPDTEADNDGDVVIDDDDVPTAANPDDGNSYIWIIAGVALIVVAAVIFLMRNKKSATK